MKAAQRRELGRMKKIRAAERPAHFFWWHLNETYDKVEERIRAKIARGAMNEDEGCFVFSWIRPEDDEPKS